MPSLHPEVAAILIRFAEDALTVERARRMFHAFDTYGTAGLEIQMPSGSSMAVAEQDIRTLSEAGYIYTQNCNTSGTFDFYVTAERVSRRSFRRLTQVEAAAERSAGIHPLR